MFEELDVIMPEDAFGGPMQMALDEVLLSVVRRPTLRVYRWETPCVTFGYFQPHILVEELHPGLPSVRRWTGGGVVVHRMDMTFSMMIPSGHPVSRINPALFYRELHGAVARNLDGRLAGDDEVIRGPSCFLAPSRDDLMVGGKKVLGGAIRRSGGALLYQGSMSGEAGSNVEGIMSSLCKNRKSRILESASVSVAKALADHRYASLSWHRRH